MTRADIALIILAICATLLLTARYINNRAKRDRPGCYGHYRVGDSRALCGCDNCELEYECEQTAKERWGANT